MFIINYIRLFYNYYFNSLKNKKAGHVCNALF